MEGIVYGIESDVVFLIPNSGGYICTHWKQYRLDANAFPPEDTDITIGPVELVVWLD